MDPSNVFARFLGFMTYLLLEDEETTSEGKGRDLVENGRDQNEMQNNKKVFPPWEHNNGNKMVETVLLPREHNNENACSEKMNGDEQNRKKEKQMTYRVELLGLDNSEMSSDFWIYSVCEALHRRLRSV